MNVKFMRYAVLIIGVAAMLSMSGCKKKPKTGPGMGGIGGDSDNLIIPSEMEIYGEELGDMPAFRPDEAGSMMSADGSSQFAPVYFGYDSSLIPASEQIKVDSVAAYLNANPNTSVIIEGNTDERGSRDYNLALGERRALAVRAYLIGLGVEGARVQTKSYGEENPVDFGHDESAWAENRRGDFAIFY